MRKLGAKKRKKQEEGNITFENKTWSKKSYIAGKDCSQMDRRILHVTMELV